VLHIAGADNPDNPDQASITTAKEWQEAIAVRRYAVIVDEAHSSQTGGKDKFVQSDIEAICQTYPQVYFAASVL